MSGGARSKRQFETGRSGIHGLRDEGDVALRHEVGEVVIVDVRVDGLERDVVAQRSLQGLEEGAVGLGVPEVAAVRVSEREAAQGSDDVDRAYGFVQARG